MQFREFLAERRKRHDATGNFARLALADAELPDFTAWDTRSVYLERLGNFGAVEAGWTVWAKCQARRCELARGRRS